MSDLLRRLFGCGQATELTAFERGMLDKLPAFDPAWAPEVQEGWHRCIAYFTRKLPR